MEVEHTIGIVSEMSNKDISCVKSYMYYSYTKDIKEITQHIEMAKMQK